MHAAGFPYAATIDQFDFTLRPELKRTVMLRFFDSSFIATASSLLLIGASGLGKTHLAVALGTKMVQLGYSVRFVPIEAATRQGVSKIRLGSDGANFALILLKLITIFSPLRIFVPVSLATFALGAAYAVWTIATQSHVTNSSVLLILLSVIMFLIGLVSEQIASLRFERPRE
jgi:uncharacterized membrane protein